MRVMINALSLSNRSGTGRYAWGLLDGFRQWAIDCDFAILIPTDFTIPPAWHDCRAFRFYSIPTQSAKQRIWWEQMHLSQLIKSLKIEILHSTSFIGPVFRRVSAKHIITVHDLAFIKHPETLKELNKVYYQWFIPKSIHQADMIITDTQTVAAELEEEGFDYRQTKAIPLGVDPQRYHPHAETSDQAILQSYGLTPPYYLFVGTREPRKNLEMLITAYQSAHHQGLRHPLAIAGRLGWKQNTRTFLKKGIAALGYVPEAHLPALYRNAHALLAPSQYEGFDLPIIEALACGTPVIASDIPVHHEVGQDQITYLPPDDPQAWSKQLQTPSLINPSQAQVLTWQEVSQRLFKVYMDISQG